MNLDKSEARKPKVYVRVVDENGRAYGLGRRKESSARVYIKDGTGAFTINQINFEDFSTALRRTHILEPFQIVAQLGKFDIAAYVHGGGESGKFFFL
jgi:small subunit ribosomal protein S9